MKPFDVLDEYTKNKELRAEDLHALQEWIQKLPHMPQTSEHRLILFLHRCHWSMELAKLAIEKFVTCRGPWTDFFASCNPLQPEIVQEMAQHVIAFLPRKTPDGSKILYIMLVPDFSTVDGMEIVCDATNMEASHVAKISVRDTKRYLLYMQDALPVRFNSFHFVISSGHHELIIPLVKPFIKKELSRLLHFHKSYEALFGYRSRELFPKEVGGEGPALVQLHEGMRMSLIEKDDLFGEEEKLVANFIEDFRGY